MDSRSADSSASPLIEVPKVKPAPTTKCGTDNSASDAPSKLSASGISTWAKNLKIPQPFFGTQDESPTENSEKSNFARFTCGLGLHLSPKSPQSDDSSEGTSTATDPGFIRSITKGLVYSSKSAVKAWLVVSQNK